MGKEKYQQLRGAAGICVDAIVVDFDERLAARFANTLVADAQDLAAVVSLDRRLIRQSDIASRQTQDNRCQHT